LTPRPNAPGTPGTYAVVLESTARAVVEVGQLGPIDLRRGSYVYVGSALGPGGLHARIGRHLDPGRPVHWHFDYLKHAMRIVEIWYVADPMRREHSWARTLGDLSNATIPMPGFGASDCRCASHLFHFPTAPRLARFARALGRTRGAGAGPYRVFRPASAPDDLSPATGNRGAHSSGRR